MNNYGGLGLAMLGLATAMHTDWHFARPAHHQLSLGWTQHWLAAIPVFALAAWYVNRTWPARVGFASVVLIGGAAVLAHVVEPLWELADGATFEWAFGAARQTAFVTFSALGIAAYAVTLTLLRRGRGPAL